MRIFPPQRTEPPQACSFMLIALSRNVVRQRRPAEKRKIHPNHDVLSDAECISHTARGVEFDAVSLPVADGEGVCQEPLLLGQRQRSGRVQATAEKNDGGCRAADHEGLLSRLQIRCFITPQI